MFCTQCGTAVEEGKKFCRNCGASLGKREEPEVSAQTQEMPSYSAVEPAVAAPRARASIDRTQVLPVSPRESRGMNKTVIAVAGVVILIAVGAGIFFGTDLFRATGPETATKAEESLARPEPAVTPPAEPQKEMARIDNSSGESDFSSPLWTTPGEPLPPIAMESPKSLPEPRPTPKTEQATVARRAQSQKAGLESVPREQAPTPPSPASIARPTASPGTYQTIRPTRVFESPSVTARVVARIDDGIRVNVVGSSGDWLEVRSRSGNPPGFIRRDDAVRVE